MQAGLWLMRTPQPRPFFVSPKCQIYIWTLRIKECRNIGSSSFEQKSDSILDLALVESYLCAGSGFEMVSDDMTQNLVTHFVP